jgi:poly(3-hydroxybutyrate) depolymerase
MAGGAAGAAGSAPVDPNAPEPSSGCDSADAPADGATDIVVGDLTRSYVLRKPASYDAKKPWRLLLALHPNGSSSSYWDGTSGERAFRPLVADDAVLVLPQARDNDWRGDVPLDLSYFDALIERIETTLCIDKKRIVAAGFSGGGSFSGALGCYRTDIRAIAVGGAVSYFEEQDCIGKPAVWITIGDGEAVQGRLDFRDYWRSYAGCQESGSVSEPATCTAYDCPDPKRPVEFCSHPGDHVWPSFGTEAAWAFLSSF